MSKATKRERQKENRERAREERERLIKRDRRMKATRGLLFLLAPLAVIAIIVAATSGDDSKSFDTTKGYTATIETSEGTIVMALDAKKAPKATEHFVGLVNKKYYDGLCFDRLATDFVIQGGSPKCDQQGGAGTSVKGELPTDHYPIGALGAAKTPSDPPGTFDAQFFIVTGSQGAALPNDYARFGTVISGLDVAQKIEKLAVPGTQKPASTIIIKRIRITVSAKPSATTSTSSTSTSSSSTSSTTPSSTTSSSTSSSSTTSTTTKP